MGLLKKVYCFIDKRCNNVLTRRALPALMLPLPVKSNKVVFINFDGRGYGCNPKYIAEEILRRSLPWDLVWLVENPDECVPKGIRKATFGNRQGIFEVATAKVIVTNVKTDLHLIKKRNQYVIQTWHGSYGAKLVEKEAEEKLPSGYIRESKRNSRQTDLVLSNSEAMTRLIKESFWYDGEILECGLPRNDMLFSPDAEKVAKIKAELGLSRETKLVLYAPTFRDGGSMDAYGLDCEAILEKLRSGGEDWRILTRLHPNVCTAQSPFPENEYIINATHYPDIQELLLASDILITDYSSTPFEFAAMGKQVYIFATDIASYQTQRGLKDDFFTTPYPVNTTNEELLKQIDLYSPELEAEQAAKFMACFGGADKGNAAQKVVDHIEQVVSKK